MKDRTRQILILCTGVVLGVSLSIVSTVFAEKEEVPMSIPVNELRTFNEVFAKIKSDYVEPVDDKTLLENAIRGMLQGLDPHSNFLDADGYKELQVGTTGEFGGLGIEVGMEDGFVKVISPIDDTPADRGGVKAGDVIIRLDDTPVKGLTLTEAVKIMRGKPGSKLLLTIVREGSDKPIKIELTRDVIRVQSVKYRMLDQDFAYLRITSFQSKTGDAVLDAIKKLKKEAKGGIHGLVIDLRNNPGGVLNAAVEVSDAFLTEGLIVYTEGRDPESRLNFSANPDDVLDGAPIVVLVNEGSASASEIVAGALQDHKRAIIMGSRSFGKGSVQTILPLLGDAALKLTTARYFTPSGRSIQAEGIQPNIVLAPLNVTAADEQSNRVKEADLARHLENNGKKKESSSAKEAEKTPDDTDLAQKDYNLYEALNILRAMKIMGQINTN
ncbi:MAG: S41 family peptidase [Gammaproteobacteria bacterium]|nr:S41 family peptidase [Gammaproteobacteria bacterium]